MSLPLGKIELQKLVNVDVLKINVDYTCMFTYAYDRYSYNLDVSICTQIIKRPGEGITAEGVCNLHRPIFIQKKRANRKSDRVYHHMPDHSNICRPTSHYLVTRLHTHQMSYWLTIARLQMSCPIS